jgi:hypothetical protein
MTSPSHTARSLPIPSAPLIAAVFGLAGSALAQCPPTFAPVSSWPMGSPYTAVVGDFNHDGKLDLAAANVNGSNVTFRFADPNLAPGANYLAPVPVSTGLNPRGAAAADFNHDGITDFATVYNGGGPANTRLAIMLSNGNGTFQTPALYLIATQPTVIRVADLNHDGNPDLAYLTSGNAVGISLGNPDGTFQASTVAVSQPGVKDLTIADLNGDGALDLAMTNYDIATGNSMVAVALGTSPTSATYAPVVNTPIPGLYGAYGINHADFNGDGRDDLVITHSVTFNRAQVLLTNPDGSLVIQPYVSSLAAQPIAVATADFNGDGRADIAIIGSNGAGVGVWMGTGAGGFVASASFPVTAGTNSITTADMNNDGRPDIVTADGTSGNVSILFNTTATFAFNLHPFSKSVCPGGTSGATFTAHAVTNVPGGITSYRWERLVGSTWTTLPNAVVPGVGSVSFSADSSTMFIIEIPGNPGDLVANIRCVATNACGSLPGNPVTLRIIRPCGGADVGAIGGVYTGCGDGVLDNNDFVVFIDLFFNGNVVADVGSVGGVPGADGHFDNNDFVVFIDMFFGGCTI